MSDVEGEIPEDRALAAEYALGLLNAQDRSLVEARILVDADLKAEVIYWQEHFVALADRVPSVAPDKRMKSVIERRIFGVPVGPTGTPLFRFIMAGAAAAVVALSLLWFWPQAITADYRAILADGGNGLRVEAAYQIASGDLIVDRLAGRPDPGRTHELWVIFPGENPISLGVLSSGGETTIALPEAIAARIEGATLAISDEPPGGSPTGQPTGAVLAAGPVERT